MRRIPTASRWLAMAFLLQGVSACSFLNDLFPDHSKDYKKAQPSRPLEVPPDLMTTSSTDALVVPTASATLSGYESARKTYSDKSGRTVLPAQDDLRFERDRDRAWLVVKGEPEQVWSQAREFWLENGFFIMEEDPVVGVLETDWVENRESIPKDPIRGLVSRVIPNAYSAAYRDRYRMRLERGEEPGTTEIFITHQGVEEVVTDASDEGVMKWAPRPRDPGMESIMLKRLMVFLGVQPEQAGKMVAEKPKPEPARAELIQNESGQAVLVLHDDYSRAWRNLGIVLDRVDFAVEDRDRLQGIYYVRYNDPTRGNEDKGLLSKLAFWSSDDEQVVERYQIKLVDDGADSRVVVLNEQGEPDTSVTAVRILTLLYEELK